MFSFGLKFVVGNTKHVLKCVQGRQNFLAALQVANITSKATRAETVIKPAPFDYKNKRLSYFRAMLDNTLKRFDENTKLIVVEGNIAAGKSAFSKQLAEELDMLHMPEVTTDLFYVNDYGYDFRQMNPQLPEGARSFDVWDFYKRPHHKDVAQFQLLMYKLRFNQYVEALCHMLNTGQGVILERCVYSDSVFMETLRKFNYISKGVKSYYQEVRKETIPELMQPHLVIYLDVPVNILMDRIKKRNIEYEVNSKVLTKEYLTTLEDEYRHYLNGISKHAELLVYDWSMFGDTEVVVEDIERINFDIYDKYDVKLSDWRLQEVSAWNEKRYLYTSQKEYLETLFNIGRVDVPEVLMTSEEADAWHEAWNDAPGNVYQKGYNKDLGDKGILFKISEPPRSEKM